VAKYKPYSYAQGQLIPEMFSKQIQQGTFEYTLSHLIDNELNLSIFDGRFHNDETGAPAYDPRILLKIILFAYSRGITSSRKIAQCCEENIIFMALSANTSPHFTTISDFISIMDREIIELFREILLVCDEMGLIGREMFAVDGCKLPSNASKEWSGTKADFKKKCVRLDKAIERIVKKHRAMDDSEASKKIIHRDENYISTVQRQLKKIRIWMDNNDDKPGYSGTPIKSNITDNDSAKMKTSNGIIQGEDVFNNTKLTAGSGGFHTNKNADMLSEEEIDGYVADRHFRSNQDYLINRTYPWITITLC
jgi:transposase